MSGECGAPTRSHGDPDVIESYWTCSTPAAFPDGRCYRHTEDPEQVARRGARRARNDRFRQQQSRLREVAEADRLLSKEVRRLTPLQRFVVSDLCEAIR